MRSVRGLTRDAKAVSGKPEGINPCGDETISHFAAELLLPSLCPVLHYGLVFDPDVTCICYRGCLNLNCYIGNKM